MNDYSLETKCIHSGYTPSKGEPCALPICQSTTYKYDTTDEMGQLFDLKADGYFYTRLQNPTTRPMMPLQQKLQIWRAVLRQS